MRDNAIRHSLRALGSRLRLIYRGFEEFNRRLQAVEKAVGLEQRKTVYDYTQDLDREEGFEMELLDAKGT